MGSVSVSDSAHRRWPTPKTRKSRKISAHRRWPTLVARMGFGRSRVGRAFRLTQDVRTRCPGRIVQLDGAKKAEHVRHRSMNLPGGQPGARERGRQRPSSRRGKDGRSRAKTNPTIAIRLDAIRARGAVRPARLQPSRRSRTASSGSCHCRRPAASPPSTSRSSRRRTCTRAGPD